MTTGTRPAFAPVLLQPGRTAAMNALICLTLSLIGAAGVYNEALRSHKDVGFLHLFEACCLDHVPACLSGIVLQLVNRNQLSFRANVRLWPVPDSPYGSAYDCVVL